MLHFQIHKPHPQIVDITGDWSYPRKNREKSCDSVIVIRSVTGV